MVPSKTVALKSADSSSLPSFLYRLQGALFAFACALLPFHTFKSTYQLILSSQPIFQNTF